MWISGIELLGGLILLIYAADWVVHGAVNLAQRLNISAATVGLTVVAYGTSLPEMVVSVLAARRGIADFALGNVVGSNIANVAMVLGAAAALTPIVYSNHRGFGRDFTFLALGTGSVALFLLDGVLDGSEGIFLLAVALLFTYSSFTQGRAEGADEESQDLGTAQALGLSVLGLAGLTVGAHFMVEGGTDIARIFGIDERIIGLSVVAIGTSLPELAASITAARKGQSSLAVGNVMGSCLFNLTFVLGAASVVHPMSVDLPAMRVDLAILGAVTLVFWFLLRGGRTMTRVHGWGLLVFYGAYLAYLATLVI